MKIKNKPFFFISIFEIKRLSLWSKNENEKL